MRLPSGAAAEAGGLPIDDAFNHLLMLKRFVCRMSMAEVHLVHGRTVGNKKGMLC